MRGWQGQHGRVYGAGFQFGCLISTTNYEISSFIIQNSSYRQTLFCFYLFHFMNVDCLILFFVLTVY